MKSKYPKEVQAWIDNTKTAYTILKCLPKKHLQLLADQGGLDLTHYKTKSLLAKGLLIKLNPCLPIEMNIWK